MDSVNVPRHFGTTQAYVNRSRGSHLSYKFRSLFKLKELLGYLFRMEVHQCEEPRHHFRSVATKPKTHLHERSPGDCLSYGNVANDW